MRVGSSLKVRVLLRQLIEGAGFFYKEKKPKNLKIFTPALRNHLKLDECPDEGNTAPWEKYNQSVYERMGARSGRAVRGEVESNGRRAQSLDLTTRNMLPVSL